VARSISLLAELKKQLKKQSITYKKLAAELDLTESTIKQMFASENMSLKRMDAICDILNIDISDLVSFNEAAEDKIELLTIEQEKILVGEIKLLLVAYCVVNSWTFDDIIERYDMSEPECIAQLTKLDKMRLIELLPGNRIKPLIANNFNWQPDGPIEHFFRTQVQNAFFDDNFGEDGCLRLVKNGDISLAARNTIAERLKTIGHAFDDTLREERKIGSSARQGTTMVLAIRNWQFSAFLALERPT
jgi:DNA-binding Xre family transcriptional regulator